jgi:uncharacterized protein (TIGR01244 family)
MRARIQKATSIVALLMLVAAAGTATAQELKNRKEPLPGITSSAQPDEAALKAVAKEGYVAVIDLRGESEDRGMKDEKSFVESLGMRYVALPVENASAVTYDKANALDEILKQFDGPVLVHCASGNRVGGVLALREHLKGASAEDSFATGIKAGMSSQGVKDVVEEQLKER